MVTTSQSTTVKGKALNLSTVVKAKNDKPWASKPKINFTPLREYLENALKMLLANQIITFPNNSRPYNLEIKPKWWNNNYYCDYHRNKGHKNNECMKIKNLI